MRFLVILSAIFAVANPASPAKTESIVLGGGCFWCMDATYKLLPGVTHITCGYGGSTTSDPTYEDVCSWKPPGTPRWSRWTTIRPRSALSGCSATSGRRTARPRSEARATHGHPRIARSFFTRIREEKAYPEEIPRRGARGLSAPIVTSKVAPLKKFWPAEDYHQDYFEKNPDQAYCSLVIRPKVDKLKKELGQR